MLPLTRSRNRARFFGTPFSPEALFAGGTVAGAWYDPSDLSTLFTTSAGTTQCAMPGLGSAVSVGLMLDKSQGLVLGSELVTNGSFDTNITGWTAQSGLSSATRDTTIFTTGGLKIVANGTGNSYATQTISGLTAGKQYVISTLAYTPSTNPTNNRATIGVQVSGFTTAGSIAQSATNTIQTLTIQFSATSTTQTIYCSVVTADFAAWGTNGAEAYFDNISVRELAGNHAIAFNNTTARPELRARVNLLTYSEEFDNGAWTAQDATVANTTATADPLGGNTADILTDNAVNTEHRVVQISPNTAGTYVWSFWAKANTLSWLHLGIPNAVGSRQDIYFDVGSGALGTVPAGYTATIASAGNGWWRCTVTGNTQANAYFVLSPSTANNVQSYAGTGQSLFIWGADLRPTNIGANVPAYQRIADANTYDTSGFPLYLRFDGIDDSMYTPANLNLSGTDKVAVFAGVRKLSTALGFFAELSANTSANNGSFYVVANNGTNDYGISLRGTAQATYQPVTYTAPISNVLAVSYDIAGAAISDEIVPRVNGVVEQDNPSGANAGTGNFGTYPLYIGARNNASGWLNGQVYGLLVVGSAVSAGNINATEQWVAGRTGISIP